MLIAIATTDDDIAACYPVLRQLRPKLDSSTFVADVRRMQQQGYVLASLRDGGAVRAVAGYRYYELFATGLTLYVDDLVTDAEHRSSGYGERVLQWLKNEAASHGCNFLTLDSGLKRVGAHRFYRRHGLEEIALHFAIPTDGGPMWTSE
ncbi:MAG TPA: GNAT family N-acetyltransferase [Thermoanaerobaculia bacterium]|nr:GNAT family N-acetyltransferase [Thermoanaerobaculia bacterium]